MNSSSNDYPHAGHVTKVIASAPPLSPAQRDAIVAAFGGFTASTETHLSPRTTAESEASLDSLIDDIDLSDLREVIGNE